MKREPKVFVWIVLLSTSALALAQSGVPNQSSEGLDLLQQVGEHYADAKSYYVEATEERRSSSQDHLDSTKTFLKAAEAPGNRYRYEGHSWTGSALKVSDGSEIWSYRFDEHRYTVTPRAEANSQKLATMEMSEQARLQAEGLRKHLAEISKNLNSAERLPDEIIMVDGHPVSCEVVRFGSSDAGRVRQNYIFDRTVYIDATRKTVLRTIEHAHSQMQIGSAHLPMEQETTTSYTVTELDEPVHNAVFTFAPPSDATLVADFPNPMDSYGGPNLAGEPVPPLKLKSSDGKVVPIESLRGKPVLIDFWATWCSPCLTALAQFANIYNDGKGKGLLVFTVDQDQAAITASDFLAKKGYAWQNFHDGDGEIEKLMGSSPIPRTVLIDAQGKIAFDSIAPSEDRVRTEIAKLGPEYASLAPKPQPKAAPCVASASQP